MRRWLTFGWVTLFVLVIGGGTAALSWRFWEELKGDGSETIRNLGLVAGGVIAIGLALWRSRIAERQAETAERDSLDDKFYRAAEMLGHELLTVRVVGVAALQHLALNHLDRYGWQVVTVLLAFMDLKRNASDETGKGKVIEGTFGGTVRSYEGTVDGADAFEAYWTVLEKIEKQGWSGRWEAKWRRAVARLRHRRK